MSECFECGETYKGNGECPYCGSGSVRLGDERSIWEYDPERDEVDDEEDAGDWDEDDGIEFDDEEDE